MEAARVPRGDVGLCLSGGGYRASVFHLGALIRINEAGLLPRLRTVSSVSGGSIVAGFLGLQWSKLIFDADGVATNLDALVIDPMMIFTGRGLDAAAVLTSAFIPGLVSRRVQRRYQDLFGTATLGDLPGSGEGPEFVITATNLATGSLFRFSRGGVGDFRSRGDTSKGFFQAPTIPLTLAVAASSAFPPVLSPCRLKASDYATARAAQRTVYLTDGGIYDNLGMEPLADPGHRIVLSSDGGAPFRPRLKPPVDYLAGTVHVLKLVDLQVRKLRRSELVRSAGPDRTVGYWSIDTELDRYVTAASTSDGPPLEVLEVADDARAAMAGISTRLAALSPVQQHRLMNWGYAVSDAALRSYVVQAPRGQFPYPGGVG